MERRESLKTMSMVLGYTLTPAALTTLMTACSKEASVNWQPKFFTKKEAFAIEQLAQVMLPTTDTPGALDVNAHVFVDLFYADILEKEEQEKSKKGLTLFISQMESMIGKSLGDATLKDFQSTLEKYFTIVNSEQERIESLINGGAPNDDVEGEYYIYSFLFKLKDLLMMGYFQSEEIGENVLAYLPVPGKFEGCIPFETGQRAWAL